MREVNKLSMSNSSKIWSTTTTAIQTEQQFENTEGTALQVDNISEFTSNTDTNANNKLWVVGKNGSVKNISMNQLNSNQLKIISKRRLVNLLLPFFYKKFT